jgi:hypothetical protein
MAAREKPGPPMTLGNMRRNGVRALIATCQACGHKADVNVDVLAATIFDPEAGRSSAQPMRRETDRYPASVAYEVDEKPRGGGPNAGERRGPNYAKDVLLASH